MHRVHRCLRTLTARVKPAYDEEPGSNTTDDAVLHGVPFEALANCSIACWVGCSDTAVQLSMRGNLARGERRTGASILSPGVILARQWCIVDVSAERLPHAVRNDEPLHSEQGKPGPCSSIVPSTSAEGFVLASSWWPWPSRFIRPSQS